MAPTAVKPTTANHFEALYEAPFQGVNSESAAADIGPSYQIVCTGLNIRQGKFVTELFSIVDNLFKNGIIAGTFVQAFANINGNLYCWDDQGNSYILNPTTLSWEVFLAEPGLAPVSVNCIQIINGIAYMFNYSAGLMYSFDPSNAAGPQYQVAQIYAAGLYCCVVDGYLLTANSNQPTDDPPVKTGRVNWSAPYEFGQWDASVNRDAGYNVLADVQDQITGIFALANVAFVLRTNGMTQLTPTGIGIQPFDFPTLFGGDFGVGCSYPNTLDVYGTLAAFGDSSDFYLFSGGVPDPITGMAKTAIYSDINNLFVKYKTGVVANTISGKFCNCAYNNTTPELYYVICIAAELTNLPGTGPVFELIFWSYCVRTKAWTRSTFDFGAYLNTLTQNESLPVILNSGYASYLTRLKFPNFIYKLSPAFTYPVFFFSGVVQVPNSAGTYISSTINCTVNIYQCLDAANVKPFANSNGSFQLQFKEEEVKLGRTVTVIRVVIKASGTGTIIPKVGNITFTPIVVNNNYPTVYTSSGVFTGQGPQLSLTSDNFYGTIVKAMMTGTYADGDYA